MKKNYYSDYTQFVYLFKWLYTDYNECSATVTQCHTIIAVVDCITENANWFKFVLTIYTKCVYYVCMFLVAGIFLLFSSSSSINLMFFFLPSLLYRISGVGSQLRAVWLVSVSNRVGNGFKYILLLLFSFACYYI